MNAEIILSSQNENKLLLSSLRGIFQSIFLLIVYSKNILCMYIIKVNVIVYVMILRQIDLVKHDCLVSSLDLKINLKRGQYIRETA